MPLHSDIAVSCRRIGFDNLNHCELVTPKLTSIAQDIGLKAQRAGDHLFKMIGGADFVFDERLPIRVVERQSVRNLNE